MTAESFHRPATTQKSAISLILPTSTIHESRITPVDIELRNQAGRNRDPSPDGGPHERPAQHQRAVAGGSARAEPHPCLVGGAHGSGTHRSAAGANSRAGPGHEDGLARGE